MNKTAVKPIKTEANKYGKLTRYVGIRLLAEHVEALDKLAVRQRRSRNSIIEIIIEDYLRERGLLDDEQKV